MPGCLTELRSAAATVAAADPAALSPSALGDAVVELRQVIDALEGAWSGLVAALDGSGAIDGGTAAWLRSACRLAPAAARARVVLSRRLGDRAAVASALADGTISVDHARLVTTALAELGAIDPGLAVETEAPLVAAARRVDPTRLRREIAHARHALVPAAAADADEQAYRRRHLDVATTFDGTVAVHGILDPEGGETLLVALASLSGHTRDDDRTPGQRRADALVELCHRQLDRAELPALGGERPHLSVLVPLAALAPRPTAARPTATGLTAASATAPGATAASATDRPCAAMVLIRPGAGTTTAADLIAAESARRPRPGLHPPRLRPRSTMDRRASCPALVGRRSDLTRQSRAALPPAPPNRPRGTPRNSPRPTPRGLAPTAGRGAACATPAGRSRKPLARGGRIRGWTRRP